MATCVTGKVKVDYGSVGSPEKEAVAQPALLAILCSSFIFVAAIKHPDKKQHKGLKSLFGIQSQVSA